MNEVAEKELLTESLWLRRVVDAALRDTYTTAMAPSRPSAGGSLDGSVRSSRTRKFAKAGRTRLCMRLRHDDWLLLHERSERRGMPVATYVAALTRAHLRNLAPIPEAELAALKSSLAELGAIGRNLNQIARVAHRSGRITGPDRENLKMMLKVCEAMREHIKALIWVNHKSWESGYAEAAN